MSTVDGELDEDAVWGAGSEGAASEPEPEEERRGAPHDEVEGGGGDGGVDGGSGGGGGGGVGVGVGGGGGGGGGDCTTPLSAGPLGRPPLGDAEAEAAGAGPSAGGDEPDGEGGGLSRALGRGSAAEAAPRPLAVPSPSRRRHTEVGELSPVLLGGGGDGRDGGGKAPLGSLGVMDIPTGKRPRAHTDSALGRLGTSAPINIPSASSELQRKLLQETQPRTEERLLAQSFVPPHLVGDLDAAMDFGSTPMKADMLKRRNLVMKQTGFLKD